MILLYRITYTAKLDIFAERNKKYLNFAAACCLKMSYDFLARTVTFEYLHFHNIEDNAHRKKYKLIS